MIGNIVIIFFATGLTWYSIKVFGSDLKKKPAYHITGVMSVLIIIFSIILPNIEFIKSPIINKFNVKVIENTSNEPITGATVIVDWGYSFGEFPMHRNRVSIKQQITTTDSSGDVIVPKAVKCLAINLFPLYSRNNGELVVMAFHPEYKYESILERKDGLTTIRKNKYINIDDVIADYSNYISLSGAEDRKGKHEVADAIKLIASRLDMKRKHYLGYKEKF